MAFVQYFPNYTLFKMFQRRVYETPIIITILKLYFWSALYGWLLLLIFLCIVVSISACTQNCNHSQITHTRNKIGGGGRFDSRHALWTNQTILNREQGLWLDLLLKQYQYRGKVISLQLEYDLSKTPASNIHLVCYKYFSS